MISIRWFLLSFLLIISVAASGQAPDIKAGAFGYKYIIDDVQVNHTEFKAALSANPDAFYVYKSNVHNRTVGVVLAMIGGGLIGHPIGRAMAVKNKYPEPNWNLAIYGGVAVALGVLADNAYKRSTKWAIEIYNKGLTTSTIESPQIIVGMGVSEHGVGLQVRF